MSIKRVHIVGALQDDAIEEFKKLGYHVSRSDNLDEKNLLQLAYDAQVIVLTDMPFKDSWFSQLPHLKMITRRGVGYDNISIDVATQHGVWVTNTPGANAVSVAEMTIILLLNTIRHIKNTILSGKSQVLGHNLQGKTVGIVGYGRIAKHVESILSGFGVNILVYNHREIIPKYAKFVDFQTLITQSDIITLHIPATQDTEKMFNHNTFLNMKNNAILINTARGALIDEHDLVVAIQKHQILGAGLDTIQNESLNSDRLAKQNEIFVTPHIGANTVEAEHLTATAVVENVIDFFKKQQPRNAVNHIS